jgi:hypothetical protein
MELQILDLPEVKSAEMNHYERDLFQLLSEAVSQKKRGVVLHDGDRPRLKCEKLVRVDFDIVFDERGRVETKQNVDVNALGCG